MTDLERRLADVLERQARSAEVVRIRRRLPIPALTRVGKRMIVVTAIAAAAVLAAGTIDLGTLRTGAPASSTGSVRSVRIERLGPTARSCTAATKAQFVLAGFATSGEASACALWVSADRGATWSSALLPLNPSLPIAEGVAAVEIAPNGSFALAGTNTGRLFRAEPPYQTWNLVYTSPAFQSVVRTITVDTISGSTYVAVKGVIVSDDEGRTWRDITGGLGSFPSDAAQRGRFGVAGAGELGSGVAVAINGNVPEVGVWWYGGDRSWRRILAGSEPIAMAAAGQRVLVAVQRGSGVPAAWISDDAGSSFTAADYGSAQASGAVLTAVGIGDAGVFAASADGLLELRNRVWERIADGDLARASAIRVEAKELLVSTPRGLWRVIF